MSIWYQLISDKLSGIKQRFQNIVHIYLWLCENLGEFILQLFQRKLNKFFQSFNFQWKPLLES